PTRTGWECNCSGSS
ncbi:matrix protein 2, partial [Influenza A virus]